MTMDEFNYLSIKAGFGACAPEMWDDVNLVYMSSDDGCGQGIPGYPEFSKREMVNLYWKHTGHFEELVRWARGYYALQREVSSLRAALRRVSVLAAESVIEPQK